MLKHTLASSEAAALSHKQVINNTERNTKNQPDISAAGGTQFKVLSTSVQVNPSDHKPAAQSPFTRKELVEFHLERIKVDDQGIARSQGSIRNQRSNAKNFLDFSERQIAGRNKYSGDDAPDENDTSGISCLPLIFGEGFNKRLGDYAVNLETQQRHETTINDRISTAWALKDSYQLLIKIRTDPESFGKLLERLIENSGMSVVRVAQRSDVPRTTLRRWSRENAIPQPTSLGRIQALESVLKVPRGALSGKFPDSYWIIKGTAPSFDNAWNEHMSLVTRSVYRSRELTPRVKEEWDDLVISYTDPEWTKRTGLKKNSMWRIRWNTQKCPAEIKHRGHVLGYLGFLALKTDNPDPWLRGLGINEESFTLGMMGIYQYVKAHLEFLKKRTLKNLHSRNGQAFIEFSITLLRPETGYIWQHPYFGEKLPEPVSAEKWHEWCEGNREQMRELEQSIFGTAKKGQDSKKKNVPKLSALSRDPFTSIRDYIETRDRPITVLWELSAKMDELEPVIRHQGSEKRALHYRDKFLIDLMPSNPLRCENHAMMTYIPANWVKFAQACEEYERTDGKCFIYVGNDPASNLYQKPDGTWHLRFNPEDFKNEEGAASGENLDAPYDVPLPEDIWPVVREYIFRQRLVLLKLMKSSINNFREKQNLSPLTEQQQKRIDRCQFVFRPSSMTFRQLKYDDKLKFTGTEQVAAVNISRMIRKRTKRLLGRTFGAHACRHIVASDLAKAYPDGIYRASIRLHITMETAAKHYAWVTMSDKVKPLNDEYMILKRQWQAGQA
jgi:hypothetical protein